MPPSDTPNPSRIPHRRRASRTTPTPIVLWSLRGATDTLRGLAIETSFGYALGLELDGELVLLHLQPTVETLVAYAERFETALVAQGWHALDTPRSSFKEFPCD